MPFYRSRWTNLEQIFEGMGSRSSALTDSWDPRLPAAVRNMERILGMGSTAGKWKHTHESAAMQEERITESWHPSRRMILIFVGEEGSMVRGREMSVSTGEGIHEVLSCRERC